MRVEDLHGQVRACAAFSLRRPPRQPALSDLIFRHAALKNSPLFSAPSDPSALESARLGLTLIVFKQRPFPSSKFQKRERAKKENEVKKKGHVARCRLSLLLIASPSVLSLLPALAVPPGRRVKRREECTRNALPLEKEKEPKKDGTV